MVISKVTMCLTGAVSMLSRPPGPCKYSAARDELLADTWQGSRLLHYVRTSFEITFEMRSLKEEPQ